MREWAKAKIGEVSLGIYDGPHATPAPCETPGPYFLGIPQISPLGFIDMASPRYIAERDYGAWTKRVVPQYGDVVFSYEATLNLYALIPRDFKCCLGRRMGLVRPNPKKIDFQFLYYYFFSPEWRGTVRENTITGATVDRLSIAAFPNFEIALPPLPIQRRIAAILSNYDSAIDNARRQIALLEEAAMRLYREWFVVHADPKWEKRRLGELIETLESGSRPRGGALKAGVPSIGAEKVDGVGIYDFSNEKYISEDYFGKMRRGVVKDNDVLLYKDGAYAGKVSMIVDGFPHVRAAINEHVFRLRTKDDFAQHYLYTLLRQQDSYTYYNTVASAKAAQPGLNQDDILDFEISFPSVSMMERYEQEVKPLFHSIGNQANKIKRLTEARDRLLPKLMSGEVSV